MYLPSAERVIWPSEPAVPLAMSLFCMPFTVVGRAMDCTSVPVGVYSSRKTGLPVLTSEPVPVPMR
ncbi:hypothetical protein BGE01nite_03280 [Brevifollis gellanilyticus]|uniref:Uncharacterized protein n=1 Tax=Brevifollis gellanilyticus TaxID=748831 RepID=A0A512M2R9_9BACT|nr:hypothetical protein BGE01nite_03280 [Brevifollis gellanilyticus]